jgi:hypothetical protein
MRDGSISSKVAAPDRPAASRAFLLGLLLLSRP